MRTFAKPAGAGTTLAELIWETPPGGSVMFDSDVRSVASVLPFLSCRSTKTLVMRRQPGVVFRISAMIDTWPLVILKAYCESTERPLGRRADPQPVGPVALGTGGVDPGEVRPLPGRGPDDALEPGAAVVRRADEPARGVVDRERVVRRQVAERGHDLAGPGHVEAVPVLVGRGPDLLPHPGVVRDRRRAPRAGQGVRAVGRRLGRRGGDDGRGKRGECGDGRGETKTKKRESWDPSLGPAWVTHGGPHVIHHS